MSVYFIVEREAVPVFEERAKKVNEELEALGGLRLCEISLRTAHGAPLEQYRLDGYCEADDVVTAVAAITRALDILSEGLMHVVRRMPEGESTQDFESDTCVHRATVRAIIVNQPGHRAAAQRGHDVV